MPQDLTDDKSTLVQVMAWCRQATSHYLSQCWARSMSPNCVTRPQWVKIIDYCLHGIRTDLTLHIYNKTSFLKISKSMQSSATSIFRSYKFLWYLVFVPEALFSSSLPVRHASNLWSAMGSVLIYFLACYKLGEVRLSCCVSDRRK